MNLAKYKPSSLAWSEIYLLLANLFRRFEINIFDTTDADMEWVDLILVKYVQILNILARACSPNFYSFKGRDFRAVVKKREN